MSPRLLRSRCIRKLIRLFTTLTRCSAGGEVPYWTLLDAPLMYKGGEGEHDPAYYQDILDRVSTTFGN